MEFLHGAIPQHQYVVQEPPPQKWWGPLPSDQGLLFQGCHEKVGQVGGTFCAHGHSTLLGVEMFLKREVIVPKDDPEEVPCHVFPQMFPTGGRGRGKDSLEGHLDPRSLRNRWVQRLHIKSHQDESSVFSQVQTFQVVHHLEGVPDQARNILLVWAKQSDQVGRDVFSGAC